MWVYTAVYGGTEHQLWVGVLFAALWWLLVDGLAYFISLYTLLPTTFRSFMVMVQGDFGSFWLISAMLSTYLILFVIMFITPFFLWFDFHFSTRYYFKRHLGGLLFKIYIWWEFWWCYGEFPNVYVEFESVLIIKATMMMYLSLFMILSLLKLSFLVGSLLFLVFIKFVKCW